MIEFYQVSGLSVNCAPNESAIIKRQHTIQIGRCDVKMRRRMLLGIDMDLQSIDAIDKNTPIKKELGSIGFDPDVTTRI